MERRADSRLTANRIPVQVFGLGENKLRTTGRIVDASPKGLRIEIADRADEGAFLQIEFDDATILGEVRYCQKQDRVYATGVFVEQILIGTSELARLVDSLLREQPVPGAGTRVAPEISAR